MSGFSEPSWLAPLRSALLPALAAADLRLDLRTRLNIETWIQAALARGHAPQDAALLRQPLRALVCKSAREERHFDELFDEWLTRAKEGVGGELVGSNSATHRDGERNDLDGDSGPSGPGGWTRRRVALAALAALVVGALAIGVLERPRLAAWWQSLQTPTPIVVPPGAGGSPAPAGFDADALGFDPAGVRRVTTGAELMIPPRFLALPWSAWLVIVVMLSIPALWVRQARREQLARISADQRRQLREQQVFARELSASGGVTRAALRKAARELRRRRGDGVPELDVPASVQATAQAAVRFQARYRTRGHVPEYVALIDCPRPGDVFAQLAHDLVRALAAEGVRVTAYSYDRDPRWVTPLGMHRAAIERAVGRARESLASLPGRREARALFVFGDGEGLIDPTCGRLHDWVRPALQGWARCAWFTPMPFEAWGAHEALLAGDEPDDVGARAGASQMLLVPALTHACPAVAAWLQGVPPAMDLAPGGPRDLPPLLRGDGLVWLRARPPEDVAVVTLLGQLRAYLGGAYLLLVATAAYPHVSADLTRYLADRLAAAPGPASLEEPRADPRLAEEQLMALAVLPWMRYAYLPDWLRVALLRSEPDHFERIRAIVLDLLKRAGGDAATGGSLGRIAREGDASASRPSARERLQHMIQRLRAGQGWRGLLESEPKRSALRDVIYLGVLNGTLDATLVLDVEQVGAQPLPASRLTRNPLRWGYAAGMTALVYPLQVIAWAAQRAWETGAERRRPAQLRLAAPGQASQRWAQGEPELLLLHAADDRTDAERLSGELMQALPVRVTPWVVSPRRTAQRALRPLASRTDLVLVLATDRFRAGAGAPSDWSALQGQRLRVLMVQPQPQPLLVFQLWCERAGLLMSPGDAMADLSNAVESVRAALALPASAGGG